MNTALMAELSAALETSELYRGRAHHARMGAQEAPSEKIKSIFERLAASYEALAEKVESVERLQQSDSALSYDALTQTLQRLQRMSSEPSD
jgi:chemotaxis protein histidine kinase CheA